MIGGIGAVATRYPIVGHCLFTFGLVLAGLLFLIQPRPFTEEA